MPMGLKLNFWWCWKRGISGKRVMTPQRQRVMLVLCLMRVLAIQVHTVKPFPAKQILTYFHYKIVLGEHLVKVLGLMRVISGTRVHTFYYVWCLCSNASEILFFPLQKVNTGLREDRERKLPRKTATQQQLRLQQQRPHILFLLSPVSTTTECLCSSSCFFNVSNHATDVSNLL